MEQCIRRAKRKFQQRQISADVRIIRSGECIVDSSSTPPSFWLLNGKRMNCRPTIAEIDLNALQHNFRIIRKGIPDDSGILAVVKADAYGHGHREIALKLEQLGAHAFGVAFLDEGTQLRECGIGRPILVMGGLYPGEETACLEQDISAAIFTIEQAQALDKAAGAMGKKAKVHLKVDTGMGRLGIPNDSAGDFLQELEKLRHLELEGIFSHFATADENSASGIQYAERQEKLFRAVVEEAAQLGITPRYIHIANSAATLSRQSTCCNLLRPGIALYGAMISAQLREKYDLQPVMRLKSGIALLKWVEAGASVSYGRRFTAGGRTLVASIPVGYGDGYPRSLTNRGEALVRGIRVPVIGTVCMDWIMLDVTKVPGVAIGDDVTLMGCDAAGCCIRAEEVAGWAGTISYELFCGISKRVPRIYLGN